MFDAKAVEKRLKMFGYEIRAEDKAALTFCVEKVRSTVKNEVNCQEVPEGLEKTAVDMAAGEFLFQRRHLHRLTWKGLIWIMR